ncbi:MAG: hypothetical protein ACTHNS_14030 [Marmoricola sp.]
MTAVPGPGPRVTTPSAAPADDRPARAEGVQLIGEMVGSGYREPPALARRRDGQTVQLTPLLYAVLVALDGARDPDDLAGVVSAATGRAVSADNVRTLVDRLRPMGLVAAADGSSPPLHRSNPLLALRFRLAVTDPERTRRLTTPFATLFHPVVVAAVLLAFVASAWWVLVDKGLASATSDAFTSPGLLVLIVVVTVLSAGFHEFGHASAARRAGATPGVMGMGLYLVWPAFYTDVTDSYRLGRRGRVLTDLGGLYFNAIVAVLTVATWLLVRDDALLLVVASQLLLMVRQLTPVVRFDGYHVLADLTGVPDLYHRIGPTLRGLLPWRWHHPESTVLKPWARAVVSAWVLVVVPLLLFSLFTMVVALPRVLGTAAASVRAQSVMLGSAWGAGDLTMVAARVLAVLAVAFPILASLLVLTRLLRAVSVTLWRRTRGRPVRRSLAGLVALTVLAGLVWAWWPHGNTYRPIRPDDRGTLLQAVGVAAPALARTAPALAAGQRGAVLTGWPAGEPRPTKERPQLAVVLVPRGTVAGRRTGSWVFPFDKPLSPGPGDNQALAVNTTSGTVTYDVAFALVWVTDGSPALPRNEAYAFADCSHCAAVSVAFQVVLVTGDNHVSAPQNIAAAVNYSCVDCLTYALAVQLFATTDGPLSAAERSSIERIWKQAQDYAAHLGAVPLSTVREQLTAYEDQIRAVINADQSPGSATSAPSPGSTATPTVTPAPAPTATVTATSGARSAAPSPSSTGAVTSSPPSPSTQASPTGAGTPTSGASPTASPTGSSTAP